MGENGDGADGTDGDGGRPADAEGGATDRDRADPADSGATGDDGDPWAPLRDELVEGFRDLDGDFAGVPAESTLRESFFDLDALADADVLDWRWVDRPFAAVAVVTDSDSAPGTASDPGTAPGHDWRAPRERYHVLEPSLDGLGDRWSELVERLRTGLADAPVPVPESRVLGAVRDSLPSVSDAAAWTLRYYAVRRFSGYGPLDVPVRDPAVRTVSVDGPDRPVYVDHATRGSLPTNLAVGAGELDDLVGRLLAYDGRPDAGAGSVTGAGGTGEGGATGATAGNRGTASAGRPTVPAPAAVLRLPNGARAQVTPDGRRGRPAALTVERPSGAAPTELTTPATDPVGPDDLDRHVFGVEGWAFLWLAVENGRSVVVGGAPGDGRTVLGTALTAFLPPGAKVATVECGPRPELPHENLVRTVRRDGDPPVGDLVEAALGHRPDVLFVDGLPAESGAVAAFLRATDAVGTAIATTDAGSVEDLVARAVAGEGVARSGMAALDLFVPVVRRRVRGRSVSRVESVAEVLPYDAEHDEFGADDVYRWQAETDEFLRLGDSVVLDGIQGEHAWSERTLRDELFARRQVLDYLAGEGVTDPGAVLRAVDRYRREGGDALDDWGIDAP